MPRLVEVIKLIDAVTAAGSGVCFTPWGANRTFQAVGLTSSGAGAASITIQGSNTGSDNEWIDLGTITLVLSSTKSTDGFASDSPWRCIRAKVNSISGTGATVTVYLGNLPL